MMWCVYFSFIFLLKRGRLVCVCGTPSELCILWSERGNDDGLSLRLGMIRVSFVVYFLVLWLSPRTRRKQPCEEEGRKKWVVARSVCVEWVGLAKERAKYRVATGDDLPTLGWDGMLCLERGPSKRPVGGGGGGDVDADAGVECCVGGLGLLGLVPVLLREDVGDGIMRLS